MKNYSILVETTISVFVVLMRKPCIAIYAESIKEKRNFMFDTINMSFQIRYDFMLENKCMTFTSYSIYRFSKITESTAWVEFNQKEEIT